MRRDDERPTDGRHPDRHPGGHSGGHSGGSIGAEAERGDRPRRGSGVLIGLRGCGKSTLGRLAADSLGVRFVDLDDRTPLLLGAENAADAINAHGLAAFRDAEREALAVALAELEKSPAVLALGGGTPTAPGAADLLRGAQSAGVAWVVYLHAPPNELRDRLRRTDTASRPSLTGLGMLDEIETIYLQRDGVYRGLADHIIETASAGKPSIAASIVGLIGPKIEPGEAPSSEAGRSRGTDD